MSPSDSLFDPSLASWASEYFSSHGDDLHTMKHIADMDIEPEEFENLADSFTTISTQLGVEAAPMFRLADYRDKDLEVSVSMLDQDTMRFEIHEKSM